MSHGDPHKWHLPGWRIEQKFSPGVLIGNWSEQQHNFLRGNTQHNSTHRADFSHYGTYRPDVVVRRNAMLKDQDGHGKEALFYHHGKRYSNNLVSWYDEHFNKRPRDGPNQLPPLRSWDSNKLAWVPEKSDYPIQGAPTNFGLSQKLQQKWSDQVASETYGDYNTTYNSSYEQLPSRLYSATRFATPREKSTTLHKYNHTNRNLNLRNVSMSTAPEDLTNIAGSGAMSSIAC